MKLSTLVKGKQTSWYAKLEQVAPFQRQDVSDLPVQRAKRSMKLGGQNSSMCIKHNYKQQMGLFTKPVAEIIYGAV